MLDTPLDIRRHNLKFIDDARTALDTPQKWCLDGNCPDTNWGGTDRLHGRGEKCPNARITELGRLIGVARNQIMAIDAVWSELVSKEFVFLDDAQRAIYDHICLSWSNGGAYDIAALAVASTERDVDTHVYRVSVSFEEFWKFVPSHRRDVLERNAEEMRAFAERTKVSHAAQAANELVSKLMNDDLSKFTDDDINLLSTSLQTLADTALNGKETS